MTKKTHENKIEVQKLHLQRLPGWKFPAMSLNQCRVAASLVTIFIAGVPNGARERRDEQSNKLRIVRKVWKHGSPNGKREDYRTHAAVQNNNNNQSLSEALQQELLLAIAVHAQRRRRMTTPLICT